MLGVPAPDQYEEIARLPLAGKLTPQRWHQIEAYLDDWKAKVLAAAKRHPARSYQLGQAQVRAFADLLADLQTAVPADLTAFGGEGPTMRQAVAWQQRYLHNELEDALNKYIGRIKDELLYGLRFGLNPTAVASRLFNATKDASINWRTIARTEMVRANAAGRLAACADMGYDRVWCPPHAGSCNKCRQLLENKVFLISEVQDATNYGRRMGEWVACIPLHPHCRHSWLPYEPDVYAAAQAQYGAMEAAGLTDDAFLDAAFDSSGQMRPEYADHDFSAAKTMAVAGLAAAVWKLAKPAGATTTEWVAPDEIRTDLYQREIDLAKVLGIRARMLAGQDDGLALPELSRREDGTLYVTDGQHRIEAHKLARPDRPILCKIKHGLTWGDEHDRCRAAIAKTLDPLAGGDLLVDDAIAKALVDVDPIVSEVGNTATGLDPLLFDGLRIRPEVRARIEQAWETVAGPNWAAWSFLYLPAWGTPEVVIDWPSMRAAHPDWKKLADTDLHLALVIQARALIDMELVPGRPLDLRIRPEHTPADYVAATEEIAGLLHTGGPIWSLAGQTWIHTVPDTLAVALEKTLPDYGWSQETVTDPDDAPQDFVTEPVGKAPRWFRRWIGKRRASAPTEGWHVAPAAAREKILEHGLIEAQPNDRWRRYGAAAEPAGIYVWTDRARALKWAADMHRLVGDAPLAANDVWQIDLTGLDDQIHKDPVLGDQGAIYLTLPSIDADRLTLDVTKTTEQLDVDVAKAAAAAKPAAANSGVEHWITVHPNGDGDKGQPVLVRNNTDGTMTVIGGAGGNLNYMRIDPRRRITREESKQNDREAKAEPERILTAAEQMKAQADLAAHRKEAQQTIEKSEQKIGDLEDQLRSYVEDQIGAKWLTHGLTRHGDGSTEEYELGFMERKQAMRKLVQGALQTLSVGQVDRKDAIDAPYLFTQRQGDFEDMPDPEAGGDEAIEAKAENGEVMEGDPGPTDPTSGEEDLKAEQRKVNRRLPSLSEEQANEVLRMERAIAKLTRVRAKARKSLKSGDTRETAMAMEWSDADLSKEVQAKVEAEQRTIAARELLQTSERNTYKVSYARNLHRGAFDTLDSFTHAVLGVSAVPPEVARLLGPEGTAQMIAHVVREKATAVADPSKLDLEKPLAALTKLTDSLEADVAQRATARARKAMETGVAMRAERKKSEKGDSLWTASMTRSYELDKLNEASAQLGMAIGGFEAASALKAALEKPPKEITVSGLESPSQAIDLAQRAKIKLDRRQITKNDSGNYTLKLPMDQVGHLFDLQRPPDWEKRELLKEIRTGKGAGMARAIDKARDTPGMVDKLSPAQAQGKMFLLATDPPGSHRHWNLTGTPIEKKSEDLRAQLQLGTTLDFAPGVGKTHTAIAAAMQLMNDEPDAQHRVLVVAPTTAIGPWAATVMKQGSKSVNALGSQIDDLGGGKVSMRGAGRKARQAQLDAPADFNIISHDMLKRDPAIAKKLGATIVVTDETQKFKNERNQRSNALREAGDAIDVQRPAVPTRSAWGEKYGQLERGYEHITREDKIRQFREGIDDRLFHMSAADAGNDLPGARAGDKDAVDRLGFPHARHQVQIDPEHMAELQDAVTKINQMQKDARAEGRPGIPFGGQMILNKLLYDRPHNAFAKKAADVMAEQLDKPIEWGGFQGHPKHADGENAGTYDRKGVVFSQFTGTQLAHVIPELEAKGLKVFYAHGGLSNEENERVLNGFTAHKGKAVLVTSDKNSTARSLQFGDNNGRFQHGATELLHYSLPDQGGNATVQQRNARILRRGAQVECGYHTLWGNTPAEMRQMDRLTRELKTQQMAGNSEQLVGGRETLRHRLSEAGVAPANELSDAAPEEDSLHAAA